MRTITLNNGAVYTVTACGASGGVLWITIPDYPKTMLSAVMIFSDPDKTRKITHAAGENDVVTFEGYTRLASCALGDDGELRIALEKAA